MDTRNEEQSLAVVARLPLWVSVSGAAAFIGSALLATRLIWEQTVWTWERGPQMVGFSLAHGPGAILFLFPAVLLLWTLVVVFLTVQSWTRKFRISSKRYAGLGLIVLLFAVIALPEGFWQRAFVRRMVASPRAGDLLMYAAARGDVATARALVSHGVPIDATDHAYWRTGLHAAAAKGDLSSVHYFVSQGADINLLDRAGDSPVELAVSGGHDEVAKFLTERGAKQVRGSEAQREKAISDQVQETIEEMHR